MQLLLFKLYAAIINTSPLPRSGLSCDSGGGNCVPRGMLVVEVFNVIFALMAGIAFISVVYGGFKYVISRGEPDKIGKAKDLIMYSLIGLVISFCAFGIANLILNALG